MPRKELDLNSVQIKVESLMREDIVVDLYERRGYTVVTRTEEATHATFKMPKGPTADLVIQVSARHAILAEVKGSDLAHALVQLRNTAPYVRKRYDFVAYKVFLKTATPSGDRAGLRGGEGEDGRLGFRALRIFNRYFPAEWLLLKNLDGGDQEFVRIEGETVSVIFGPYPKA